MLCSVPWKSQENSMSQHLVYIPTRPFWKCVQKHEEYAKIKADMKQQNIRPFSDPWPESQTPPGALYTLHMVSLGSILTMCFAPKTPQKSDATWILQLELETKSPSPVEYKSGVHSAIELLMMIWEGFKETVFFRGGGSRQQIIKLTPVAGIGGWKLFAWHMQTCPGVKSEATGILQLALGNESPSPVEHKSVIHSAIELLMMIWEGFKVSDVFGGVKITNHESFTPVAGIRGQKFYMQTCQRVLYKLNMVSLGSVPNMCFAPKNLPKTQGL